MPDSDRLPNTTTKKSYCRLCQGFCGVILTLDDKNRLVDVRADREDPHTLGFACLRGLEAVEAHYGPDRILHPLRRKADGTFEQIPMEQALDEIAQKVREVLDSDGPEAIAGYKGTAGYFNSATTMLLQDWLSALGSPKFFSSFTIDQSGKLVAAERIGSWLPGFQTLQTSDVALLFGANPLVSVAALDFRNPHKRLRDLKAKGLKLILVDPRRTETAHFADIFVQPVPGEDAAILCGMLRIIFENEWYDKAFCERYVADTDKLRKAVARFTPAYVASRAGITADELMRITRAFAVEGRRGIAGGATGPSMSPYSNLSEHLILCLNYVCGRVLREGEEIANPGFILPRYPRPEQVIPATRSWEKGPKSRFPGYGVIGYGTVWGQMLAALLADEILTKGPGQVKILFNHGGNPLNAIPDPRKTARALRSLDLLVSIDPFMSPTSKLAHYIIPTRLIYERPDFPMWLSERTIYPRAYTRYTPQIIDPPDGSDVAEEGYLFWALAKRLGIVLKHQGVELDMSRPPTPDELLAIVARHTPVPFEEIKKHTYGMFYEDEPQYVVAGDPHSTARLTLMPDDVAAEVKSYLSESSTANIVHSNGQSFAYRLAVRRIRDRYNSYGQNVPDLKRRAPFNVAYVNPDDLADKGGKDGDWVEITSDNGTIQVIAEADPTVRRGVVCMTHSFGSVPEDNTVEGYLKHGLSPNLLVSTDRNLQSINAMPRMSGIPVNIRLIATPNIGPNQDFSAASLS